MLVSLNLILLALKVNQNRLFHSLLLTQKNYSLELDKLPLTKAKSERLNSLRCELRCVIDGIRTENIIHL